MPWAPKDIAGTPEMALRDLRVRPKLYGRAELGGDWGIAHADPGRMVFHAVLRGRAWLEAGGVAVWLEEGDCVLVPTGEAHTVAARRGMRLISIEQLARNYQVAPQVLRYGGDETVLLCGSFEALDGWSRNVVEALPRAILKRAGEGEEVAMTLRLVAMEARHGDEAVLQHLTEVLFLQMLRSVAVEELPQGWWRGARDERIGRVLGAMHQDAGREWTSEELAEIAGQSRSAFHERFVELMGRAPMEYLAEWRLSQAEVMLRRGDVSVGEVAERVGYRSEAAFSRSFKRRVGVSPGLFRRGLQ